MDVEFEFDPFEALGEEKPRGVNRRAVLRDIADFTKEQILDFLGNQNSPVSGHGKFPKLSKDYKFFKRSQGKLPVPDLELTGAMVNALRATLTSDGKVKIKIGGKQGDKADGHNNHSGQSKLPLRRFIPTDDEMFKQAIKQGWRQIIKSHGNDQGET